MAEIKHIVVLMLENRSFDHMVGWLQSPNYPIDGVDGTEFNRDSTGEPVRVTNEANYSGDYDPDVAHDFVNVTEQIFGASTPAAGAPALMSGFVTSYGAVSGSVPKSHRVMNCFNPTKLPVLCTLAQQYALCTRWFSSVPGPTLPNRAYAHAATSVGHVDMTINWWKESKTIYELLADHNYTAKIYYTDSTITLTYGGLLAAQDRYFVPDFNEFFHDCDHNNLPDYAFLEPRYNAADGNRPIAASDQHPDHDVSEGESLILQVFKHLRGNTDTWNSTLLVIVYDEHGGLFDHIPPPSIDVPNPDGINSNQPFFAFDRLGVRVPAVLVSPYIEPGTIVTDVFDHSSLIATARKVFLGAGWQDTFLTQRDRAANTFEGVLTRSAPRSANEVDPTKFHELQLAAHTISLEDRARQQASTPLSEHQQALTAVMASAAATQMTQSQAADLHEQVFKTAVHGPGALGAGR